MFSDARIVELSDGHSITVLTPIRKALIPKWYAAALGTLPDASIETVGSFLRRRRHLIKRAQIEEIQKRTNDGEITNMCAEGWGNWFPALSPDANLFRSTYRTHGLGWLIHSYQRDVIDGHKFDPNYRVLLLDYNPSRIGL